MKKKIWSSVSFLLIIAGLCMGGLAFQSWWDDMNAGKSYEKIEDEFVSGSHEQQGESIDNVIDKDENLDTEQNEDANMGEGTDDDSDPELVLTPIVTLEPTVTPTPKPTQEPVSEFSIDFNGLMKKYPDVYAWIRIPGTSISYPIAQKKGDNAYYLTHNISGKKKSEGAIYTENYNSKSFTDANTVIYGHNMKNGSMFKGLHKYKDRAYFNKYNDVIIYLPNQTLHYQIFAAYVYDNRHLHMSFDFEDKDVFRYYLNSILNRKDMNSIVDTSLDITTEDKIITLSTCNANSKQRYLVQAVLISIEN